MSDLGFEGYDRHYRLSWARNCALGYTHDDLPPWAMPVIYCANEQQREFLKANPLGRADVPRILKRLRDNAVKAQYPQPVFFDDNPQTTEQFERLLEDAEREAFYMEGLLEKKDRFIIWCWADLHALCWAIDNVLDEPFWERVRKCSVH